MSLISCASKAEYLLAFRSSSIRSSRQARRHDACRPECCSTSHDDSPQQPKTNPRWSLPKAEAKYLKSFLALAGLSAGPLFPCQTALAADAVQNVQPPQEVYGMIADTYSIFENWRPNEIQGLLGGFVMMALILGSSSVDNLVASLQRSDLGLCKTCGGVGTVSLNKEKPLEQTICPTCKGTGEVAK